MNLINISTLAVLTLAAAAGASNMETMNNNNAIPLVEQSLTAVSANTAAGNMPGLSASLQQALDAGLGMEELKEILVQLYAYCGFPRSLNALDVLKGVVEERSARGIHDEPGRLPNPLPAGKSVDLGAANQTKLCGAPVKGALFDFAPAIDAFLKSHLFGDIFGRDNVDWKTRELATIAALAAMPGTESQLAAHIRIGRHNGLNDAQIDAAVAMARTIALQDPFPKGTSAPAHFTGDAWVSMLVQGNGDTDVYNVTFAPGTRNDWHRHAVGQILLCTQGTGYYQERGRMARRLEPGSVVSIPADTWHWHGAGPSGVFVHIGITPKSSENSTVWGETVGEADYASAISGAALENSPEKIQKP